MEILKLNKIVFLSHGIMQSIPCNSKEMYFPVFFLLFMYIFNEISNWVNISKQKRDAIFINDVWMNNCDNERWT